LAWTLLDRTPPPWDPADHINTAYDYYRALAHLDLPSLAYDFFVAPHYYAPLVHLLIALAFLAFGASRLSAAAVNLASLAVLLISVEWLGRRIFGGAQSWVGVLAALLAACYHFPAWLLHDNFLDHPLMAITAASMALLVRAGDFSKARYAAIFGVAAGLGMLTKQTFAFFLALPSLYVAAQVVRRRDRRAILNLAMAAAIAIALAAIWYIPHMKDVALIYKINREAAIQENEAPLFSLPSNLYYFYGLVSHQTQLPLGLLFLGGLAYSICRFGRESLPVYLWLISGLASFTFIANKDMRYTVPALPAVALLSVCWFDRLSGSKLLARSAAAAVVILALVSFLNAQWPRPGEGLHVDLRPLKEYPSFRLMIFARHYYGYDRPPSREDWNLPAIVREVGRLGPRRPADHPKIESLLDCQVRTSRDPERASALKRKPRIFKPSESVGPILGVAVNMPFFNPSSAALYARLLAGGRASPPLATVVWLVEDRTRECISECDYILVRARSDRADWLIPIEQHVADLIRQNPSEFIEVRRFSIPGSEAILYRRSSAFSNYQRAADDIVEQVDGKARLDRASLGARQRQHKAQ
jgi:hypothetical protein